MVEHSGGAEDRESVQGSGTVFELHQRVNNSWAWLPLFKILTRQTLKGVPDWMWDHMLKEVTNILYMLQKEASVKLMSFEPNCHNIVRALKLYIRVALGRTCHLAHLVNGMTMEKSVNHW